MQSFSTSDTTTDPQGLRLSKRVAMLRQCSRFQAEALITQGLVKVDGRVVDLPQSRVQPEQVVEVDASLGRPQRVALSLLWNKPAEVEPPDSEAAIAGIWLRQQLRPQAWLAAPHMDEVPHLSGQRWWTVTSLAKNESGLWLLTQDTRVLTHWRERQERLEQEWLIDVQAVHDATQRETAGRALQAGLHVCLGEQVGATRISWQSDSRLRLVVRGPRWCRREEVTQLVNTLCALTRLQLLALRRQRLGAVSLGSVLVGQWRCLLPTERV